MPEIKLVGIDAGGTMTDALLVDEQGGFAVGKAQSDPHDEAAAIEASILNGLRHLGIKVEEALPTVEYFVYSGTSVLNRLLERTGDRVGLIVSAGQEDYLRLERGKQTYVDYSYDDQLHAVSHVHNVPLVPRERVVGVRERISTLGTIEIPLYERDVDAALDRLVLQEEGPVDAIVVCLLYGYKNPTHEQRIAELAKKWMKDHKVKAKVPVYLASDLYPLRGDLMRLNTALIDAYTARRSRETLRSINGRMQELGYKQNVRVMTSYGGSVSFESQAMAHTVMSGPTGGVIASQYLAQHFGAANMICSDIGGTSFDVAIVTAGNVEMSTENTISRFLVNIPMIDINSIGAGTGSFITVDKTDGRPVISSRSAGYRIGTCWPEGGITEPTINDCNVLLGRLNPDYFLGGDLQLDVSAAHDAIRDQVAKPLGLSDPYEVAAGILRLVEMRMRDHLQAVILSKGYTPELYTCVCYGGAGPTHVAGYTGGLGFQDVLVPTWAPAFSAFGCAAADAAIRRDVTADLFIPPRDTLTADQRLALGDTINATVEKMEKAIREEFGRDSGRHLEIEFSMKLAMLYRGQLKPLEITSPVARVDKPKDLDAILDAFEDHYGKVYTLSAKFPGAGFIITGLASVGRVPTTKPVIPDLPTKGKVPLKAARKEPRNVYWDSGWAHTEIYEMGELRPGNLIVGPAVVEAPATTLCLPPGHEARLDRHQVFHLKELAT